MAQPGSHRLLQRAHLVSEAHRQRSAELRQCALQRERRCDNAQLAAGPEPQNDGNRLLLRQHQRWQSEARPQLVPAVPAASCFHRNAQPLQACDIAAQCPLIDPQPAGQDRTGHPATRLEHLQEGEQAHHGALPFFHFYQGRLCPDWSLR